MKFKSILNKYFYADLLSSFFTFLSSSPLSGVNIKHNRVTLSPLSLRQQLLFYGWHKFTVLLQKLFIKDHIS